MKKFEEHFAGTSAKTRKPFVRIILILVLAIMIATAMFVARGEEPIPHAPPLVAGQENEQNAEPLRFAQPLTPTDAVTGLLRALRDWDLISAAQWMAPAQGGVFFNTYHSVLAPMAGRIEFNTNVERITGSNAVVEISIYAVDLQSALGDLTDDAANYLLHRELEDTDPDWPAFLAEHVSRLEDIPSLIRVKRTAPVHLILDESGNWLFDAGNPDNTGFYNAVSGGLFDLLERLGQVEAAEE